MIAYIVRRLIQGVFVLIIVSVLVFIVMRLLPGDPLMLYIAEHQLTLLPPEDIEALRVQFGLDKSLPLQYVDWVAGIFRGDLGTSIFFREKVADLIARRLPVTAYLGSLAFILSTIVGILAGVISAVRRGRPLDTGVTTAANLGITLPSFWLGILMIYLFALRLHWLPVYGYTSPFEDFWLSTRQAVMPVICLSVFSIASTARQARSSILEVVRQDYIRTAWAKGLRERVIVMRHVLKNGLIPVITLRGMHVSLIFGGAVVIETVFNIPGMGRLMVEAVLGRDYQVVQAGILLIALVVVLANLIVDISYGWLDPRVRYD